MKKNVGMPISTTKPLGAQTPCLRVSVVFFLFLLSFLRSPSPLHAKPDIDEADNRVAASFQRVQACLADRQYDEAVEILRGVMGESSGRLWPLTPWRYITVRDYCQMQLASLPPQALSLYRGRVDPLAETWYKEGVAAGDGDKLLLVVRRAFASRFGDDALLALGEMALERADYAAARGYWEKILPPRKTQKATDDTTGRSTGVWLSYPDSDIDPAAVRARLVLTSILEGSRQRAQGELIQFARLHGDARGRFGGRETNYAQALERLLAQSRQWPPPQVDPDWPTFAGTQWRNKIAPSRVDPAGPAWRIRLRGPRPTAAKKVKPLGDNQLGNQLGLDQLRIAQLEMAKLQAEAKAEREAERETGRKAESLLSFHPAIVGNLVFVATRQEILGLDLRSGKPAWGQATEAIFRDELADSRTVRRSRRRLGGMAHIIMDTAATPGLSPRTLTVQGGRLFCSMRSPVGGCYLVCLDLEAEGRLVWRIEPENDDWAFEGSPVCDGENVYVAMRMIGIRPQAYVACFDAQTGRRRWRRYICGADAATLARQSHSTHQLLTLKGRRIYYNTNLGAVAALSTADGQLQWISLYPQTKRPHLSRAARITAPPVTRNLNPCLYHRGVLYVAPSDSRRIFALDAVSGQILWQTGSQVENVSHLLGVAGEILIASGKRLYWIETGSGGNSGAGGKLKALWPRANSGPGFGRGLLAGPHVYWPTREKIYVFDQKSAQLVKSIELGPKKASGGNLIVAQGRLLIATAKELIAFDRTARKATKMEDNPKKKDAETDAL